MPVPKGKRSRSRRDKRFAGKALKAKSVASCQTCQEPVAPHQVCFGCGRYKGVKIIRTKADRMHDRGQAIREKEAKKQVGQVPEVASAEESEVKE